MCQTIILVIVQFGSSVYLLAYSGFGPCQQLHCTNGGSCLSMDPTQAVCSCRKGYTGTKCETGRFYGHQQSLLVHSSVQSPSKVTCCFLEQETFTSLLSTGWF